jgi:tRNA pseudouridine38-40 synthase
MRIALGVEYDGAGFSGWQTQAGGTGVQDAVEAAIAQIAGHAVQTICAGRTDAGVHATAQVVHFDTDTERPEQAWVRGVNTALPSSVAVRWSRRVSDDFHARYSARARRYDYWLLNDPVRAPLAHHRMGWVFRPLDADAMRTAAAALIGTHDFSAFRSAECQAKNPVRKLRRLEVQVFGEAFGRCLRLRFEANAFLHHMVRNIVGALVDVGVGRRGVEWLAQLRDARDRTLASPTFSAAGLYLTGVHYDAHFGLPPDGDGPRFFR